MIIDMRVYRYVPSQFGAFLRSYDEVGYPITSRHLGTTVGVLTARSGLQNRTLQLFAYRDADHRDECRRGLRGDPEWLSFVRGASQAIVEQSNTILRATAFSALNDFEQLTDRTWLAGAVPDGMVFDLRSYTAHPGMLPQVLDLLATEGCDLINEFAERPVCYFTADTGPANRVLLLFAYSSDGERHRRRERMGSDARFQALGARIDPLFAYQEGDLWLPRPYSPLR
ncbi:NIPSNAP family protein [Novosphingobium sp. BL-52-GroH]|uniref:NIPSNAP family protein n=1 Tax=Novosphingobium sp. BL-52-GroH TaxID=3349877 RepID=UPI00384B724F